MSDQVGGFEREVRDIIVRSGLTGVAATVLAVTIFSPAGLGGMIGTSLASSFGHDPNAAPAENPYANLPAYPSPLTPQEISDIRGTLASTAAAMEFTRAATDAKIEHVRALAMVDGVVTFTPMPASNVPYLAASPTPAAPTAAAPAPADVRLSLSEPAHVSDEIPAVPVQVSYASGTPELVPVQVSHGELADLLLAHEAL
ncbi:MAG: hypothetical protein ACREH4_02840 [Vitreimonas sp.]